MAQGNHSDASVVMFTDRGRQLTTLPGVLGLTEGGADVFLPAGFHLCASAALGHTHKHGPALLIEQRAREQDANVASDSVGVHVNFSC